MEAYAAYRVLMVEDDRGIAQAVQTQGELWNLQVRQVRDLRHVMEEFAEFDPHLVLLDIGLPCFDGYHWCTEIRRVSRVPVIFISSAADNMNIIMAMNLGADDFITKPFDQSVLMAKIQALLRRTYNFGASAPVLEHRGALLNTGDNTLTYQGQRVSLTKNEYRILLCLMQSKGRVVSREKLMERLWETDSFVDENTLTVNIGRLRKKLDAAGLPGFITTGWAWATWWGDGHGAKLSAAAPGRAADFSAVRRSVRRHVRPVQSACPGGGIPVFAVCRGREHPAGGGLPPGPSAAPADGARTAAAGRDRRVPAPGRHRGAGGLPAACGPAGGKPPADTVPGPAPVRRHGGLLYSVGPPDQNAHCVHAADAAERGLRPGQSLSGDLMRVEQYVEMVLVFLRLDSSTTDYVIRRHSLDDIVRPAVRRFAGEFIRRRLRLEYQPLDHTVVTDGKWLGFVVEQVLSNALKYTASGSVTIAMDGDDLCIRDTGMGIAAEDLPRIFEQGFTGVNGRRDRRASGIGLYLCRRICGNLGHTIRASSVPNQGTEIRIGLGQKKTLPE